MDILAPDSANFDHLIQVDTNIQPHIKSMSRILTNSIEIMIIDSFQHAIDIHSQLPHLNFPVSQWVRYLPLHEPKVLTILKNTTPENLPSLIEEITTIQPLKNTKQINPFILDIVLSPEAKNILSSKCDYDLFQKSLISTFVQKLPSYKGLVSSFAFAEIAKIDDKLSNESREIFQQINNDDLNQFFSRTFKNDFVYTLFNNQDEFLKFFNVPIHDYLKSSRHNHILEAFVDKCSSINALTDDFPTLYPNEVQSISNMTKKHKILILEEKLPIKNISGKKNKI